LEPIEEERYKSGTLRDLQMKDMTLYEVYDHFATGLRILPGLWRPYSAWEQVAWVSPPWAEDGCVWLDFPEVIMQEKEFLYAGHGPVGHLRVHHAALPKAPWYDVQDGIAFDRVLPSGLAFGGTVARQSETVVGMSMYLRNGAKEPLIGPKVQTCAYLRQLNEFEARTLDNKYIHIPGRGWLPLSQARLVKDENGKYRYGWRGGRAIADQPFIVTTSSENERLIAMTWHEDTLSLVSNPAHPCMHADPDWPDLDPGQEHTVHGKLVFFEGTLDEFGKEWAGR